MQLGTRTTRTHEPAEADIKGLVTMRAGWVLLGAGVVLALGASLVLGLVVLHVVALIAAG